MPKKRWFLTGIVGGGVTLLGAQQYQRYRTEMAAIVAQLSSGSQLAHTPHGLVEYASWGEGPPVLISHGIMGGYDQGLVLARLLGDGFRSIAVSRFGYLRSPLPATPTPSAQADAYAALLDHLGIARVAMLGASASGPSALQFALRHPDRCAVLHLGSAASHAYPAIPPAQLALSQVILRANFLFWLLVTHARPMMLGFLGISPAVQARLTPADHTWLQALLQTMFPIGPRRAGVINDLIQASTMEPYPLAQIQAPTLVFHVRGDPIAPFTHAELSAAHIPGAKLIALDEGGHFGMGNPAAFQQANAFLKHHLTTKEGA